MRVWPLVLCLLFAACGAGDTIVSDEAAVEAFCASVVPELEGVDADNSTSARTAAAEVSTAAQQLAPAVAAELTSKSVTLQANVTAGLSWSTEDVVSIVNTVCSTELAAVGALGILDE